MPYGVPSTLGLLPGRVTCLIVGVGGGGQAGGWDVGTPRNKRKKKQPPPQAQQQEAEDIMKQLDELARRHSDYSGRRA